MNMMNIAPPEPTPEAESKPKLPPYPIQNQNTAEVVLHKIT
jgi:hypothetical protein